MPLWPDIPMSGRGQRNNKSTSLHPRLGALLRASHPVRSLTHVRDDMLFCPRGMSVGASSQALRARARARARARSFLWSLFRSKSTSLHPVVCRPPRATHPSQIPRVARDDMTTPVPSCSVRGPFDATSSASDPSTSSRSDARDWDPHRRRTSSPETGHRARRRTTARFPSGSRVRPAAPRRRMTYR